MNAAVCMCANICAHVCERVCECMNASFGVIHRSACAHLCVCARVCAHACTWSLIMKSKQRKVSSELWQERDPQPSHPDKNIPFLF